ncbi:MAG: YeeE/YedE family protein [Limnohabitans sp.]
MEWSSLMETALTQWGESALLVAIGACTGLLFGLGAPRSRLCTRAAVLDCCEGRPGMRLAIWALALGGVMAGAQLLVAAGALQPLKSRFMDATGSVSGALLGGLFFGAGMVLTRGCASRLLVLGASGNLRAWVSGLVFAMVVQASMSGWLAPARRAIASWWLVDGGPSRDLLQTLGLPPQVGLALAGLTLAGALWFFFRQKERRSGLLVAAGACGLALTAAWGLTQAVASQSFEVVTIQSLSYSNASAEWLMRLLGHAAAPAWGFEAGLVPGTLAGALLGALWGREFRIEGFQAEHKLLRYVSGAVLMGFGAVLAGGCTVGAGLGGSAVFALTAWLTLLGIWAGGALSWRLHRVLGWPV